MPDSLYSASHAALLPAAPYDDFPSEGATGRFAIEPGYQVLLVKDATAAFSHGASHATHHINGPPAPVPS